MHCKSYSHFFSKKYQHICVSLDVNFNESLTNNVVSFEQLGPGKYAVKAEIRQEGIDVCVAMKLYAVYIWDVHVSGYSKIEKSIDGCQRKRN